MITPDTLVALTPFGILGLVIVAIVTIVSLVSLIRNAQRNQALLIALLIAAGLGAVLVVTFAFRPNVFWTNVAVRADWGGEDEDCEAARAPNKDFCDEDRVGRIAVCWDNRPWGWPPGPAGDRCRNKETWCTYKNGRIHVGVAATGQAPPGRVYVCARGLVH